MGLNHFHWHCLYILHNYCKFFFNEVHVPNIMTDFFLFGLYLFISLVLKYGP